MSLLVKNLGPAINVRAIIGASVLATIATSTGGRQTAVILGGSGAGLPIAPAYPWSEARDASAYGILINAYERVAQEFPVRQATGGVLERLKPAPGHSRALGIAISDDGTVYGFSSVRVGGRNKDIPAIWKPGKSIPDLLPVPAAYGTAEAIGANVGVSGGVWVRTKGRPGKLLLVTDAGVVETSSGDAVVAILAGGDVVGALLSASGDFTAASWSEGSELILAPTSPGNGTVALAAANLVVVGYKVTNNVFRAVLWDFNGDGAQSDILDPAGLELREAYAVDDSGAIAGMGVDGAGHTIAWFGTPA